MKKYLGIALVVLAIALMGIQLASNFAHAADGSYAPFQTAHNGVWYDPARSGTGFTISEVGVEPNASVAILYFGGSVSGVPTWLSAQSADWHNVSLTTPLLMTLADFNTGVRSSAPGAVGTLKLEALGVQCNALTATVNVGSVPFPFATIVYHLVPLIQPQAASCFTCPAQPVFGPGNEQCL